MSVRLILNPGANGGRCGRRVRALRSRIERTWPGIEWIETRAEDDLALRAGEAVDAGVRRVLVAGGDGSVHHAARALAGSDTALGILPAGTGNDVARSVGLPRSLEAAIEVLAAGHERRYDLAVADGRPFCCVLGVGMDACAMELMSRVRWLRRGKLLYNYAAARALVRYVPFRMRIAWDGGELEDHVLFAGVLNTRSYAGGMQLAPDARVDDGQLDLCVLPYRSTLQNAASLAATIRGRHAGRPGIVLVRTREVKIETTEPTPVTLDGEATSFRTPVAVSVRPGALRVLGAPR